MLKETWGEIWNGYLQFVIRSVETYSIVTDCFLKQSNSDHLLFHFSFCNCIICLLDFDLSSDLISNIKIWQVSCFQYAFGIENFRLRMSTQNPTTLTEIFL
jgi:hypothetical protein